MRRPHHATPDEIAAFEALAAELRPRVVERELARAVSVATNINPKLIDDTAKVSRPERPGT